MTKPDPDKIVVPRKHGALLMEPPLAELAAALDERVVGEREGIRELFGLDDSEMRRVARRTLVDAVRAHGEAIGQPVGELSAEMPLAITGHQVEFYHAGVWAKVVAVDEIVRQAENGAAAIDLLVDHDTVDRMGFDIPVQQAGGGWAKEAASFAQPTAVPAMCLAPPSVEAFEKWDVEIAKRPQAQTDALAFFLAALPRHERSYVNWMSAARTRVERSLGLNVHHGPASTAIAGPAWEAFVLGWCRHAERLTGVYNEQLGAYRKRQGIKSEQHPMPNLERRAGRAGQWELPFWACVPGEARQRVAVRGDELLVGGQSYALGALKELPFSIRPRALTLTMYTRLFLADVFVHGIGGAMYDQILDGILEELVGVAPAYGCVSAAWLLPLGQAIAPEDIPGMKHRRHHAAHNPQLVIDPFTALRTEVAERIRDRRELVGRIADSVAKDRHGAAGRAERKEWFGQLHAVNAELHKRVPRMLANLDHQIASAERAAAENKTLLWREYFFPLHTFESLRKLMAAMRGD